jgi:hypothetical protein
MMIRTKLLCCVMLLTLLTASSGQRTRAAQRPVDPQLPDDPMKTMEKARQQQRYKDMKRDAEKILELATELKQQVDRSDENTLSLDVVKKAEQIEKLAHSVKNRMRGD